MTAKIVILAIVVAVASCARFPTDVDWPESLPPMSYFSEIYQKDKNNREVQKKDQYLTWVVRFYKGYYLYADGWQSVTTDVLSGIEDPERVWVMERKMANLGRLISGEWAKASPDKVITTHDLSTWGQALLESMKRGEEEKLIDDVTTDVESLLAGELERQTITTGRYYDLDKDIF